MLVDLHNTNHTINLACFEYGRPSEGAVGEGPHVRDNDVGYGGWVRGHRPGRGADTAAGEAAGG